MGKLEFCEAVATMVGCIVGAGIFGVPYVIAQAGFLTGVLTIIVLGLVVLMIYLYLGEVVLRTRGRHQLTGYAEIYLGRWGKRIMAFSMVFGIYGSLTAYLIGEGSAISSILGGPQAIYTLLFFIVAAAIVYAGLGALEKSELFTMTLIFIVTIIIIVFTSPHIEMPNLSGFSISRFFVPYGVILFSYLGMMSIPEVREILEHDKRKMKKAVFAGMAIPIILNLVFSFVIVGAVGLSRFNSMAPNDRIATIALGEVVMPSLFVIANIFAVFAMFTSFIAVAFALKEMFIYDYNIDRRLSWALTCFIPLFIALSGLTTFVEALGVVGVVAGGIDSILIVLMFHRAKSMGNRKPEYSVTGHPLLSTLIIGLFITGAFFMLAGFF
ncbi:MAG: aromatic amino acid transport family protein [Candidatus Woesearchaeota archaeon]